MADIVSVKNGVEYSKDSIVSKQLVNRNGGTVTLFAFDAGQSLSEHTAPFDAAVQVTDGRAVISIGGKSHELKEGELVIMPANVPHGVNAPERFKMVLTMIKG